MSYKLDELDTRILKELQKDARISLVDLAEKISSSRSVVWRRIQGMEQAGIIQKHTVILDPKLVGVGVMVIAQVKMQAHNREALPNFIEKVKSFPEVVECHTLMGNIDFILKVMVKDVQAYEEFFWNRLSQIEGVREISSSIALTAVKNTTELPIRLD
ncbi:transcriptional regulator [Kordiimonas sediminis]|uniref:Transcriptional regulator n=1 Tax=Kordiimonas sediminis TaxID=1735581 RepID=A0A919ATX0_9PROT|nr:Lrp/AsnC family transcriptional regulator [Kordiimonas sediminis]GHF23968.1 transcriptional regulator [Kordiimonas sediminis]